MRLGTKSEKRDSKLQKDFRVTKSVIAQGKSGPNCDFETLVERGDHQLQSAKSKNFKNSKVPETRVSQASGPN